jgi:hypothetical protein
MHRGRWSQTNGWALWHHSSSTFFASHTYLYPFCNNFHHLWCSVFCCTRFSNRFQESEKKSVPRLSQRLAKLIGLVIRKNWLPLQEWIPVSIHQESLLPQPIVLLKEVQVITPCLVSCPIVRYQKFKKQKA